MVAAADLIDRVHEYGTQHVHAVADAARGAGQVDDQRAGRDAGQPVCKLLYSSWLNAVASHEYIQLYFYN